MLCGNPYTVDIDVEVNAQRRANDKKREISRNEGESFGDSGSMYVLVIKCIFTLATHVVEIKISELRLLRE